MYIVNTHTDIFSLSVFLNAFFSVRGRGRGKERKRGEKHHLFFQLLILVCALTGIECATLVYWDNALTN